MKTILLTGATGYLGGYLSEFFLSKNYKIIALCLNEKENFRCNKEYEKQVKRYYLDKTELKTIFKENIINIVIHTATLYGRNKESIEDMIQTNVIFPLKVISLSIDYKIELFINTDTILNKHINAYSLTKNHFIDWMSQFSHEIPCANMKLDHFYGPNDKPVKFIAWLIEQFKNNVDSINLTEGSQMRDFIYIYDVVNAYDCIIRNRDKICEGQINTFEVGTNIKTSVKDLVITLKNLMNNKKTKLNFGSIPYRANEVLEYEINTSALRSLGWKPKILLKQGLENILKTEGIK